MLTNSSLQKTFAEIPAPFRVDAVPDLYITGISIDSRAVQPGHLFVAMQGGSADGHDFIQQAIDNGAAAIAGQRDLSGLAVPYIRLPDSRAALSWLAGAYYIWPARSLTVIGVTGTDGKTTTSNLIYQILKTASIKAGMISTVNAIIGDETLDTGFHVTTPDAHDVQRYLAQMVEAGTTNVVLETTSHAWAQHRVDACEFDIGVVTNITHEHMDEHGTFENYRAAKARLFESLAKTLPKPQGNPRLAVINCDDEKSFDFLNELITGPKKKYGLHEDADVRATEINYDESGIKFIAQSKDFLLPVTSRLVGEYNVSNCLAALTATVYGLGLDPEIAARGIASLEGIPGRMERIEMGQPFTVIVDFAHTPNALKSALEAAREIISPLPAGEGSGVRAKSRVIAVFGSAGLRDKDKRRMMAETGVELADFSILTAEDPRTESLDGILAEMSQGAISRGGVEGETFSRVPDRAEAIRFGVRMARAGDVVIVCGKGHEQSMAFGKTEYGWDDCVAVRAALAELLGVDGTAMPYLPTQDKPETEWLQK